MSDLSKLNIDVENEAQEAANYDALPDGDYVAILTASEMKETKAGNGQYLSVTAEIIDGDHKGRKVWDNLNVVNPSAVAEKIGRAQLAALCKAVGVDNPQDSEELHNKPLVIAVRKDKQDKTRNVIKGYKPVGDAYEPGAGGNDSFEPDEKPAPKKKPWQK